MGAKPSIKLSAKDMQEIETMAGLGMRDRDIAAIKELSQATLQRRCGKRLKLGRAKAKTNVQQTAYNMAKSGDFPTMTMFWLKTRCGWREKNRVELTGKDGKPLTAVTATTKLPSDPIEAAKIYQQIMGGK